MKKEGGKVKSNNKKNVGKGKGREVNDRANSNVVAENGDVHKARWFS